MEGDAQANLYNCARAQPPEKDLLLAFESTGLEVEKLRPSFKVRDNGDLHWDIKIRSELSRRDCGTTARRARRRSAWRLGR